MSTYLDTRDLFSEREDLMARRDDEDNTDDYDYPQ